MSSIDWLTVAICAGFGLVGLQAGLVMGAVTIAGFVGGALLGGRFAPLLLSQGAASPYAPLVTLGGGLIVGIAGALLVSGAAARLRAAAIRSRVGSGVDTSGGLALFALLGLAVSWTLGAIALTTPGFSELRGEVQRSRILSSVYELVPPRGELIGLLARVDPTSALEGPPARIGPPPKRIESAPKVDVAGTSVVRVLGSACGLGVAGSGWVAAPNLVVTNAHVVAGQKDTAIETREGGIFSAKVVHYDPDNDLAILEVGGLESSGIAPLRLDPTPEPGDAGVILGYPNNGPFTTNGARLADTATVRAQDSYGRGPVERLMTSFRGKVVEGNSGGPVVDRSGRVLVTVFAASLSSRRPEGLGVPNELVEAALGGRLAATGAGPCAAG